MSKSIILERDAPILRQVAEPVAVVDIPSKRIQSVISNMQKALHKEKDGVAIAAPQIGESLRIFVVSGETLYMINKSEEEQAERPKLPDMIFINPEIVKLSKKKKNMEEGCLSVRWLYGKVLRSEKAAVRALDENGVSFQVGASGLLAQIFQHEIDHLDGILFIDKATNVENIPPEDNE